MNTAYDYFILVAQELSISKAAQKSYVSHQCMSQYIKKLEDEFGVKLFYRTPHLSLTQEGQIMLDSLLSMRVIEDNLKALSQTSDYSCRGRILLGVPDSRHDIIIPYLLPRFRQHYPQVQVKIDCDFSSELERKTENGLLDMFINIGHIKSPRLTTVKLLEETFYLVISRPLLEECFGENAAAMAGKWQQGACFTDLTSVPLILNPPGSRLRQKIDHVLDEKRLQLNIVLESNKNGSFAELCQRNYGAYIAGDMFLPSIRRQNSLSGGEAGLLYFPLECLNDHAASNDVLLAYHTGRYFLPYQKDFINIIKDHFRGIVA